MERPVVIVSACLVGLKTRYDGTDALNPALLAGLAGSVIVPVCPEQLGGLPTPRPRAEITVGTGKDALKGTARVVTENGSDVTGPFIRGAEEVLRVARIIGAKEAYLKEKSPSCGVSFIKRSDETVEGFGVTAALLEANGIKVKGF